MLKRLNSVLIILLIIFISGCKPASTGIIVLGDLHYDRAEDHDMTWLADKPDDIRQVREYTEITSGYWQSFMDAIRKKSGSTEPQVSMLIQLGDLSEGLAGTPEKARQMALHAIEAVETQSFPFTWIQVKGNHDITGPGAKEAFAGFYLPMIREQTGNGDINSASYSYVSGNVQIICLDPYDKTVDMTDFLERELTVSAAPVKIIAVHEPVIPVTERCWHLYRNDPEKRERFLEIIAQNRAIVLCGHLHRYSVVRRNTDAGPVVQIMTVSVVRDSSYKVPDRLISQYGPSLADSVPEWDPPTIERRKKILAEESKYVNYYKQTDLPGFSLLKIDPDGKNIILEYYAAFGKEPYDVVKISDLLAGKQAAGGR